MKSKMPAAPPEPAYKPEIHCAACKRSSSFVKMEFRDIEGTRTLVCINATECRRHWRPEDDPARRAKS